jgi:hypothetical protein
LEWKRAVVILDDIEAALASSSRALEVHLQTAATRQRYRQKLFEAGQLMLDAGPSAREGLPSHVARAFLKAEELRLPDSAATELALSLTAQAPAGGQEDIARAVTDRLP